MQGVWFIRVYRGVQHSFPTRWQEWLAAGLIAWFGVTFFGDTLDPNPVIAAKSAWHGVVFWAPIPVWAVLMIIVGVVRLLALAVNGTFRDTIYSRYSPLVRGVCAGAAAVIWAFFAMSSLSAGTQSSLLYPFVFLLEAGMSIFILGEAGDNLRAHRKNGGLE